MAVSQIDGDRQIKSATITNTQISASAAIATSKLADSANFILRGGSVAFTANQSMGGFQLTSVANPSLSGDAVNYGTLQSYVAMFLNGLDWKHSVRTLADSDIDLSSAPAAIGSVTLATDDRVAVVGQTDKSENGLYVFNGTGNAMTRTVDADGNGELTAQTTVLVEKGDYESTQWRVITHDPIVIGTDDIEWEQIAAGINYTEGVGIDITGNAITLDLTELSTDGSPTSSYFVVVTNAANNAQAKTLVSTLMALDGWNPDGSPLMATQIWVGSAGNVAAPVAMSGDATMSATGVVTVANQVRLNKYIVRETPSGTINGSNTAFTLANTPVVGSESVYLNGLIQDPGVGNDYTISGSTITYLTAPISGDKLRVSYISQ